MKPLALAVYLAVSLIVGIHIKMALGQPTFLTAADALALVGIVMGWVMHWTVSDWS